MTSFDETREDLSFRDNAHTDARSKCYDRYSIYVRYGSKLKRVNEAHPLRTDHDEILTLHSLAYSDPIFGSHRCICIIT